MAIDAAGGFTYPSMEGATDEAKGEQTQPNETAEDGTGTDAPDTPTVPEETAGGQEGAGEAGAADPAGDGATDGEQVKLPDWARQLKRDNQEDQYFHQFSTINDLANHAKELEAKLTQTSAQVTPAEKPEDYQLEGVAVTEEYQGFFREAAHKAGLSQAQAKEFFGQLDENARDAIGEFKRKKSEEYNTLHNELRREYGQDYKNKVEYFMAGMKFIDADFRALCKEKEIDNNPVLYRTILKLGELASEDRIYHGDAHARPAVGGGMLQYGDAFTGKFG